MKINTYAVNCNDAWLNSEGDDISGSYVKYKDHQEVVAALEARCEALAAENAGLKAFGDKLYSMYKGLETSGGGFHDEQSIPYQQAALDAAISAFEEIKTTETDASLAEMRASGAEMFAAWNDKHIKPGVEHKESLTAVSHAARGFAELLRKGVRS